MDYCAAGSIKDIMKITLETLDEDQLAYVCCETLKGLFYLHKNNIIHLDIKAANILITAEGEIKLGRNYSTILNFPSGFWCFRAVSEGERRKCSGRFCGKSIVHGSRRCHFFGNLLVTLQSF